MTGPTGLVDLLEHRARLLARPLAVQRDHRDSEAVVVTLAGGHRYLVDARHVREIRPVRVLLRLPAGSAAYVGLTSSRGDVLPVADLADLLGLAPADPQRPMVLVLHAGGSPVGVLVDSVSDVVRVPAELLHRAQATTDAARSVMTETGEIVLDVAALLADHRLTVPRRRRPSSPTGDPRSSAALRDES